MSTKLLVRGDLTGKKFFVGELYEMRYQPTPPLPRRPTQSGGEVAVSSGRLQLRTLRFNFSGTGAFEVHTKVQGRQTKIKPYQPRRIPVQGGETDRTNVADGSLRILAPGDSRHQTIELRNNSFLPSNFTSAEWEGFYVNRASSI